MEKVSDSLLPPLRPQFSGHSILQLQLRQVHQVWLFSDPLMIRQNTAIAKDSWKPETVGIPAILNMVQVCPKLVPALYLIA